MKEDHRQQTNVELTPLEYFRQHGLVSEYIKTIFGISWSEKLITIPISDIDGIHIYNKYRHLSGTAKFTFDKGGKTALFCSHKISQHGSVVLCEGEMDCIKLWQEGIPAVTGTAGVSTFNIKIADPLRNKEVFLCLDTDKAGQSEIQKYGKVLSSIDAIVKVIKLPSDCKDVCEYFHRGNTKEDFFSLIENSITIEEWNEKNEPDDYAWESFDSLLLAEIPQAKWLVDRIIPFEGFSFLAGPEGSGKSFQTLTLAFSVAYGKAWLGRFEVSETSNVLFIDKENSRASIQKRLRGLGITDPDKRIHRILCPEKLELIETDGSYSKFMLSIAMRVKRHQIKLIIIDSFTDIMVGDENSRGDTQSFFDTFRELFPKTSILVLHHINKSQVGSGKSSSERFRGSSNITAQLSSGFLIKPIAKTPNEYIIEQIKSRDSAKLPEFKVNLVSLVDPNNPNDTYISKVMYEGEVTDEDTKSYSVSEIVSELLDKNVEIYQKDIDQVCISRGISGKTIQRAITTMRNSGKLESKVDPNPSNHRRNIYFKPNNHNYHSSYSDD